MYSDARSIMLGIAHSLLTELSGVGGGRDPTLGVMAADAGGTKAPIEVAAGLGLG